MHDIAGHIKNISTELPRVLNENEKDFNDIYQVGTIGYCFGNEGHITASNIGISSNIGRNSMDFLCPIE